MGLLNKFAKAEVASNMEKAKAEEKASNLILEDETKCPECEKDMTVALCCGKNSHICMDCRIALPASSELEVEDTE